MRIKRMFEWLVDRVPGVVAQRKYDRVAKEAEVCKEEINNWRRKYYNIRIRVAKVLNDVLDET